jgi:hypothetical protein
MRIPIYLANVLSVAKNPLGLHSADERLTIPGGRILVSRIPVTGGRRDSFAGQIGGDLAWRTPSRVLTENANNDLRSFRVYFVLARPIFNDTIPVSWRTGNFGQLKDKDSGHVGHQRHAFLYRRN